MTRVTAKGGSDFVPAPDRIATFDNDGTLWSEMTLYFQLAFALDRVKALAPTHPEWKSRQPFQGILVAAAPEQLPPELLDQLDEGGRLVIPVGGRRGQQLVRITRHGNDFERAYHAFVQKRTPVFEGN